MNILARPLLVVTAFMAWPAMAQSWDTSGNSQLNGTYYFRESIWAVGDEYGDLGDGVGLFGNITFNGNGTYSVSAQYFDASSSTAPQAYTLNGTYSISASGYGFLSTPLPSVYGISENVYGLVSRGIFIGSSTENQSGFNDLFIAAPLGTSLPSNATLNGTYVLADLDAPISGSPTEYRETLLQFTADGAGNLNTVQASGYIGAQGATAIHQTLSGVKYAFSNGAADVHLGGSFTANNLDTSLIFGDHYLYISPDGNFVFGGSPTGWDMFVGVRVTTGSAPNFSGLYYQTGMDLNVSGASSGSGDFDSYYGSLDAYSGTLLVHERTLDAEDFYQDNAGAFDATYGDTYTINADGSMDDSYQHYYFGAGGAIRIGIAVPTRYPYLSISVAIAAPTLTGTGVYLNPTGIENAGSSALFTSSLAPGELITLYGTGLATDNVSNGLMPTTLDGVQVMINGIAAPIYVTSPTYLTVMVPYEVGTATIANIQVINKGTRSNTISDFIGLTAPGIFTKNPVGGLGYAAARHLDGTEVNTSSPVAVGETFSLYMTGLGALSPAISSGSPGPVPADTTVNQIDAYIGGVQATVGFEGLTPTAIGLYQLNLTVPSGIASGDNIMELAGPDSDTYEALISITGGTAAAAKPEIRAQPLRSAHRKALKPGDHVRHSRLKLELQN